ncbi:MAG: Glu-tRNA(Gln) amidotransferase subunit GatE [Candidatus Bathyarchaeota archaeon]|jgi:glutamyl-tRNA(Gln) amidotransferase subunit E
MNYKKLGLKVGLEIHQQLDTSRKLFCNCNPTLFKDKPEITFIRRLRPTQSELGQIDPAAYFEFQRGLKIIYESDRTSSCLVEMDEEPPHFLNMEAVEIALTAALMMKANPVDEIHVMRKTVIDGSNTTGFQRTCVIAVDGEIEVNGTTIPIQHIGLEEDAARKVDKKARNVKRYRLDRLGIPMIEVATAPVIGTPKQAEDVAFAIGRILRATGKVIRGLGTIRQDLNISIPGGALIEVKGVQKLDLLRPIIEFEVHRQLGLMKISEELRSKTKRIEKKHRFVDVTSVFSNTKSKLLHKAIESGQKILAVVFPGFKGLLKRELADGFRLGTEMADRAKFWGGVGGIFHTDELPAYGITEEEVKKLVSSVGAEKQDAIVFVAGESSNSRDALKAVTERAREAIEGVPKETRAPRPDGTTRYMRPRPGAARMYPETDIPPITITENALRDISLKLPELPLKRLQRLTKEYGLNQKLAKQVLDSRYNELFESIVTDMKVQPTVVAVFLTETIKSLEREGVRVDSVTNEQLRGLFHELGNGVVLKESLSDLFIWLSKHPNGNTEQAIKALDLTIYSKDQIERFVDDFIEKNRALIEEQGQRSYGVMLGIVMKKLRGRADAKMVSSILKKKLSQSST